MPKKLSVSATKVTEGAKKRAQHLLKNGMLVSAKELVSKLRTFEWYPAGGDDDRESLRLKAISYIYAVHVLLKSAPKTQHQLEALLQKKHGLGSKKAVGLVRAIVPLRSQPRKRQTVIYSDIMSIVALLERFGVSPNYVSSIVKKKHLTLTSLVNMQRKYKRTCAPKKATGPGQKKKQVHRSLTSIGDAHQLKEGHRVISELEFRRRGWHVVNFVVLGPFSDGANHWDRIKGAITQTPKSED